MSGSDEPLCWSWSLGSPSEGGALELRIVKRPSKPTLVLTRLVGQGTAGIARAYIRHVTTHCSHGTAEIFHDWYQLAGYESDARRALAEESGGYNRNATQSHMLVRGTMLKMAISVTNLAMGRDFAVYNDRDQFERILYSRLPDFRAIFASRGR